MWLLWRRGVPKMTGNIYSSSSCVKPAFITDTGGCHITTHSALRNMTKDLRKARRPVKGWNGSQTRPLPLLSLSGHV